ncbi:MAG: hypothetical protein ACK5MI_10680 [Mangrovibacterium sp.]
MNKIFTFIIAIFFTSFSIAQEAASMFEIRQNRILKRLYSNIFTHTLMLMLDMLTLPFLLQKNAQGVKPILITATDS